jgi:2',3'-cyclic-nucleotide 2'-phosphodiesterase / 3'-nucleotidase
MTPIRTAAIYTGIVAFTSMTGCTGDPSVVRIAVTSDVHGMIYPYDLIQREKADHSLANVYGYVLEQRLSSDTSFFLLDNGDFLQGQPSVYYYNHIDIASEHLSARVMNYLGYDAATVGNHDIEAGPAVYGRIREGLSFPWLAANAVNKFSGEPWFEPYTVLKGGGKKIAVLGLVTPGIPRWLPRSLWPEMEFLDMVETARKWVPRIIEKEKPDLLVGLFHAGIDTAYGENRGAFLNENASLLVAREVPGFDLVFAGHDHRALVSRVRNKVGDSVLIVNPGSHARYAGEVTVTFPAGGEPVVSGRLVPMDQFLPPDEFLESFDKEYKTVHDYLDDTVTWLKGTMAALDALFGPSPMTSLIHQVQMEISGSEVSLTAPLSLNAVLDSGPILVSDLFKLYRYENLLYRMELSGKEIDGFLEYASGIWFRTMTGPGDHLLLFENGKPPRLENPYYNFSSAAGIIYNIDVSKPPGDRVNILQLADGSPFEYTRIYRVAVNSYRGNGGGGHLTLGSGIPETELQSRIIWTSELDLRQYLLEWLSGSDTLIPVSLDNWKITPERWTDHAQERDRKILQ